MVYSSELFLESSGWLLILLFLILYVAKKIQDRVLYVMYIIYTLLSSQLFLPPSLLSQSAY